MLVLLTRRQEDCERSAARFREAGFNIRLAPLFNRQIIQAPMPDGAFDFTVFTSVAAVEALRWEAHDKLKPLKAYAVGSRTASALKDRAYINVRIGNGAAKDLTSLIWADFKPPSDKSLAPNKPVMGLFPCGKVRSYDFHSALAKQSGAVDICLIEWEVYEIASIDPGKQAFLEAVSSNEPLLIPLYSPASAAHFFDLVKRYRTEGLFADSKFIVISERCVPYVPDVFHDRLHVAERPNEESIVQTAIEARQQPM